MGNAFLQGILLGFTLAILIGPAFFTLIQTSISSGFKSGFLLALGILISDITLITLCYVGASQIVLYTEKKMYIYFGIIGGLILFAIGIITIIRTPKKIMNRRKSKERPKPVGLLLKGYFLNIANPFVLLFWLGAMSWVSTEFRLEERFVISFFSGTLFTVFSTDIIKSYIANKIKDLLRLRLLIWINRIVGVLLSVSGIVLIFRILFKIH